MPPRWKAPRSPAATLIPLTERLTFSEYAEGWRQIQVHRPGTASQLKSNLRLHVYPRIGQRPIGAVRSSEIQAMLSGLLTGDRGRNPLASSTVALIYDWVGTIFKAAVLDRVIPVSPCVGVKAPMVEERKVTPPDKATVNALAEAIAPRYRALIVFGAGTGVRIGEALALTTDRVDFLRRHVTIDRQLTRSPGAEPIFGPVKDKKNRSRTIPVGQVVLDELAAHIAAYGTGPQGLVFCDNDGGRVSRATWSDVWRRAAGPLGLAKGEGFHSLRHFYASCLISSGASIKEVQERLGHSSAVMTLDIYSHLWPGDDERTREATDAALRDLARGAQH
jgi:integrase